MIDFEKKHEKAIYPDNIEDYIAKQIRNYWSDEFIVKDLANFGIKEEEASRLIAKVREEVNDNNRGLLLDDDNGDEIVHGWILFALWAIGLGGVVSFLYPLIQHATQPIVDNSLLGWSDTIEGALFLGLAAYAIVQVVKRKPNGIFLMKSYLIVCFVSNMLGILLYDNGVESDFINNLPRMVSTSIWTAIWYTFLCISSQVKRLFPKKNRIVKRGDKWLVASFLLLPIAIIVISVVFDVANISPTNKDNLQRYVEKVSSWTLPQTKDIEVSYDRKNNTLHFKQKIQIEEIYADNPRYIATLKKMEKMLSENSVAILAVESMTSYDSLVDYLDAAKADFSFTICLPDGTVILNKDFKYNYLNNIDDNAKRSYQEEKLLFQFETANSICPFEIEEGLWCKSIQFRKDYNLVEYTYQLQVDTPWMKTSDYNQLLDDICRTLPLESLKAMGITVRLLLNNKYGDQLTNMEY